MEQNEDMTKLEEKEQEVCTCHDMLGRVVVTLLKAGLVALAGLEAGGVHLTSLKKTTVEQR